MNCINNLKKREEKSSQCVSIFINALIIIRPDYFQERTQSCLTVRSSLTTVICTTRIQGTCSTGRERGGELLRLELGLAVTTPQAHTMVIHSIHHTRYVTTPQAHTMVIHSIHHTGPSSDHTTGTYNGNT